MTKVTEEARAEFAAVKSGLKNYYITDSEAHSAMLALDKHHGRTPPDPMVAKAERLAAVWHGAPMFIAAKSDRFPDFLAQLHKEFPDG